MAAPNMLGITSIVGKTTVQVVTTSATAFVSNLANSNKVFKITSLYVANLNGTVAANITVDLFRSSVAYELASAVTVPPASTLVIVDKDTPIYLEEGDDLRSLASANGFLKIVCAFEEIAS